MASTPSVRAMCTTVENMPSAGGGLAAAAPAPAPLLALLAPSARPSSFCSCNRVFVKSSGNVAASPQHAATPPSAQRVSREPSSGMLPHEQKDTQRTEWTKREQGCWAALHV